MSLFSSTSAWITTLYGLFVLIGGLMGYFKGGSIASLLSGTISSFFLFVSVLGLILNKPWGFYLAMITTLLLTAFFGLRWAKTHAIWPAGVVGIMGLIVLILLLIFKNKPE